MAPYRLNIFDQYGHVSKNLDEKEIAKCSPEQKEILFPLLAAWTEAQDQEAICTKAQADKNKAEYTLARAEKTLADVTPKWTAHQEWQRTVARMEMPEPDPLIVKRVKTATKVRDAAQEYLDQCVAAIRPAIQLRDQKRVAAADLLRAWSKIDGAPKSVGDLVKERSETENRQKMANIAAGLDPNYVEHLASTVGPSHLDKFKAGQGKGGSANYGYNANRLRGAVLPKVPSQG